jgi:hypothetical protein
MRRDEFFAAVAVGDSGSLNFGCRPRCSHPRAEQRRASEERGCMERLTRIAVLAAMLRELRRD